jgi:hypothetical protein
MRRGGLLSCGASFALRYLLARGIDETRQGPIIQIGIRIASPETTANRWSFHMLSRFIRELYEASYFSDPMIFRGGDSEASPDNASARNVRHGSAGSWQGRLCR